MSKLESLSVDSETKIVMENGSESGTMMIWRNQGVSATVVTGILDGKDMADSGEEWADIREGKVDADDSIKLWITEDGYVLRHEIDATALMNGMRSGADPEAEPVDDWSYGEYVEQMTYGDFNAVLDFEIPAEVLEAA